MNSRLFFSFFILALILCGCAVTNDLTRTNNHSLPPLGAVVLNDNILLGTLEQKSNIALYEGVTLSVSKILFDKSTLRKASSLIPELSKTADSLLLEKTYFIVEITDDVLLSNQVNNNKTLVEYLRTNNNSKIVTKIWMLPTTDIPGDVDIFKIETTPSGSFEIVGYSNDKRVSKLRLSDASIFDYETSSFCWSENNKGEWYILDVVEKGRNCSGTLSRKLKKEKSKNLFDY